MSTSSPVSAHRTETDSSPGLWVRHDVLLTGVFIGLLVLGTLVRLRHFLAAPSFWFDEAALLLNIITKGYGDLLGPLENQQAAPPFYLWTLRALYQMFGCTEWSMRLPALVGGIAMVWLAGLWARNLVNAPGMLCLVGLAATSMHGLQHADEVKPYALDTMWTILILYAGGRTLQGAWGRGGFAVLIGLGMLGPWVSFPSVFTLFGVGAAWIVAVCRRRDADLILGLAGYGILGVVSSALFWYLVGQHQHTRELTTWWSNQFLDFSSPLAFLTWLVHRPRIIANYATTGMGFPFLLLAPIGIWALVRRSPNTAWMGAGMVAAALLANSVRKYPLEGRVSYFLAPLIWLIIAAAFDFLFQRAATRGRWMLAVVMLGLCATDFARTFRATLDVHSIADFRPAMESIHENWRDGDLIWQSAHDVYEIYYGRDRLCATTIPHLHDIPAGTKGRRLWMLSPPEGVFDGMTWPQIQARVTAAGWRRVEERHYQGVDLVLFASLETIPEAANVPPFKDR